MIPLAVPNLTGHEKKYLDSCIDTSYVSSVGEYVTKLERMAAGAAGCVSAAATSAGTTGLHASLHALGVKPGELVIVPSFTFIASANAVTHCGAQPWLVDISPSDWCMDPETVRMVLESETRLRDGRVFHKDSGKRVAAVMPVYTLGNIPDMHAFRLLSEEYRLPLIADAACAIGAVYKGQPLGPLADVSVLSFNGNKTVTCGGGGMALGPDRELVERIRHLTSTARVGPEYDFDMAGFNYRMTNVQAAVGCAQMERLEEFVSIKRKVRSYYARHLENLGVTFFPASDGASCWLSGFVLPEGKTIEDVRLIAGRMKERGIESRTFWKPVHLQAPYRSVPRSSMCVTESLWGRIVTLPCSTNITLAELETVVRAATEILQS